MQFFLLLCLTLVQYAASVSGEEGQCIWYDTCGWDQDYGPDGGNQVHFLNCYYDGPAKPASDEQLELIKEICPHLYTPGEVNYSDFQHSQLFKSV